MTILNSRHYLIKTELPVYIMCQPKRCSHKLLVIRSFGDLFKAERLVVNLVMEVCISSLAVFFLRNMTNKFGIMLAIDCYIICLKCMVPSDPVFKGIRDATRLLRKKRK